MGPELKHARQVCGVADENAPFNGVTVGIASHGFHINSQSRVLY